VIEILSFIWKHWWIILILSILIFTVSNTLMRKRIKKYRRLARMFIFFGFMSSFPALALIVFYFGWHITTVEQKEKLSLELKISNIKAELQTVTNERDNIKKEAQDIIDREFKSIEDKIRHIQSEVILAERLSDSEVDIMAKAIQKYSKEYQFDLDWILSILWTESHCRRVWIKDGKRTWYISHKFAIGPAQILKSEAQDISRLLGLKFPKDKEEQIKFICDPENCVHMLCALLKQYGALKNIRKGTSRYYGSDKDNVYFSSVSSHYYQLKMLK